MIWQQEQLRHLQHFAKKLDCSEIKLFPENNIEISLQTSICLAKKLEMSLQIFIANIKFWPQNFKFLQQYIYVLCYKLWTLFSLVAKKHWNCCKRNQICSGFRFCYKIFAAVFLYSCGEVKIWGFCSFFLICSVHRNRPN